LKIDRRLHVTTARTFAEAVTLGVGCTVGTIVVEANVGTSVEAIVGAFVGAIDDGFGVGVCDGAIVCLGAEVGSCVGMTLYTS